MNSFHDIKFSKFSCAVTTIDVCDDFMVLGDAKGEIQVVNFRDLLGYEFYEYVL